MAKICIVVLGDVGRSPRMCYHASSLSKCGYTVDMVGYAGSKLPDFLIDHSSINVKYVATPPSWFARLPPIFALGYKFLWQFFFLFWTLLFGVPGCALILVQNPPGIPTLIVVWLVSKFRSIPFVVDWHNYSYSILALSLGRDHMLVSLARKLEIGFGRRAKANLCVSKAMKQQLEIVDIDQVTTLYDQPFEQFQRIDSIQEKHDFWLKLAAKDVPIISEGADPGNTLVTEIDSSSGDVVERQNRPMILVSSTSWTIDEDFGLLLDALCAYNILAETGGHDLPDVIAIITGKGNMKAYYMDKIANLDLQHIRFATPWLSFSDYATLLSCADLGVCLHMSSSGVDLPMKAVDMLGCGIPVVAKDYRAITELVDPDRTGLLFNSSDELAACLVKCFGNQPNSLLLSLRENLRKEPLPSWQDNWDMIAKEVFHKVIVFGKI